MFFKNLHNIFEQNRFINLAFLLCLSFFGYCNADDAGSLTNNAASKQPIYGTYIYSAYSDNQCGTPIAYNISGIVYFSTPNPIDTTNQIVIGGNFLYQQIWNALGKTDTSILNANVHSIIMTILNQKVSGNPNTHNYACNSGCGGPEPMFDSNLIAPMHDASQKICILVTCNDNEQTCTFNNKNLYFN